MDRCHVTRKRDGWRCMLRAGHRPPHRYDTKQQDDGYCSHCHGITHRYPGPPNASPATRWWLCENCGQHYSEAHPTSIAPR